jgi:D-serine deaminase-like pyridoxal phosphate-dependent protein
MRFLGVLQSIETPAVVVDLERLSRNIARVQNIGKENRLNVRPHIKTHKCVELAQLQLDYGAHGITASKAGEALVFIDAGFPSVTVAYPVIHSNKARRLIDAAGATRCDLRFIADNKATLEALTQAVTTMGGTIGVYIKIDVGLGRVGVKPDAESLTSLARQAADSPGLELRGLLSHAGQCYGATSHEEVRQIAESERRQLLFARDRLAQSGLQVPELSVGSTPTVLASDSFEGLSEIRPGNYVFFDLTAVRLGVASLAEVAFSVVTSVVSVNENYAIIDAGSKVLSSDLGPHGTAGVQGYGQAFPIESEIDDPMVESSFLVEKLSEEHGFVRHGGASIQVGNRLRVVPNHSCPVANLANWLYILDQDQPIRRWRVAAAGRVN